MLLPGVVKTVYNLSNKQLVKLFSQVGYQGDGYLLLKVLLPGVVKTVYNLCNKQLVKLFIQVGYQGDGYLLLKVLLLGVMKTVHNLNNKQLVKLFSQVKVYMSPRFEWWVTISQSAHANEAHHFFDCQVCPIVQTYCLSVNSHSPKGTGWSYMS